MFTRRLRRRVALGGAAALCLIATTALTSAGAAPSPGAPPGLSPSDSAQLQKLLQVQNSQVSKLFSDHSLPRKPESTLDRLFMWNEIALQTTAIDHTPVPVGEHRMFGEQFGPTRASRAMAIANIAMYEAVDAIQHDYRSYVGLKPVTGDVSEDYAIDQSMHDALVWLYPSQQPRLDALLEEDVANITGTPASLAAGSALGGSAARAIIKLRTNDGSQIADPSVGGTYPLIGGVGHWSPDPVSGAKLFLGAYWGQVTPFVMTSGSQFRPPPPPSLLSQEYTDAFFQVEKIGGAAHYGTPTVRTAEQSFAGVFWTYDGVPNLCAPPRLYNQLVRAVALQQGMNTVPVAARLFALTNTAMADAAISAWDTKWTYQFWRPVTAIRSPDQGGNTKVKNDPSWYPLGAQATNTTGPNFTPPFPAYVSGHATFGGALFAVLRHFYPDSTKFTFVSDEFNGKNRNDLGRLQPLIPQTFDSFTAAESQNAASRIYIGVHWNFDGSVGIKEGNQVGDWVYNHAFQPVQ